MELVPIMQLEIGHTNYQLGNKGTDGIYELTPIPSKPLPPLEGDLEMDDGTVVSIHTDGYPWVTVTMLSEMENVVGGETAVECGDKSLYKDPMIEDKTDIKNWLARMSARARTNAQYSSYRLKVVSERLRMFAEKIDADRAAPSDLEADPDVIGASLVVRSVPRPPFTRTYCLAL
ncbi:hypothetical protein RQP46_008529 [Phenoliferia psychrophenolica]